jgi:hypothetical protein
MLPTGSIGNVPGPLLLTATLALSTQKMSVCVESPGPMYECPGSSVAMSTKSATIKCDNARAKLAQVSGGTERPTGSTAAVSVAPAALEGMCDWCGGCTSIDSVTHRSHVTG